MTLFQGWADSPSTGAYQEQDVMEVFRQAVADTVWLPFARKVNISSGQSVTIPIRSADAEPTDASLAESESIPIDKLTITANTISPDERGRALQITRKAMNRSPIDLLGEHKMALAEQMSLDMDTQLSNAFQSGKLKYAPTGAASYTLSATGSFTAAALSNLNFYHVRKLRDLAFRTYLMPKLPNGRYALVASTAGVRGILDDPEFLEINSRSNAETFSKNQAGTIADVQIFEDNHGLSDSVGTNSDVGEAVFISRDSVYYAIITAPSIKYDASETMATSFGRFVSLAWYADWAAAPSTTSASSGYVRLIHVGST